MKIQFLAIPKTGSISLKDFCVYNNIPIIWHRRDLNHTRERIYNHDLLFCVLRNPVDRVISAYYFLKNGGINQMDKDEWNKYAAKFENINDFIEENLELVVKEQMHFRPQYKWLENMEREILFDKIEFLNFENLEQDLSDFQINHGLKPFKIEHKNKSRKDDVELTNESISKIEKIYYKDYELLNRLK